MTKTKSPAADGMSAAATGAASNGRTTGSQRAARRTNAKRVLTELVATPIPSRRYGGKSIADRYMNVLGQILDVEDGQTYPIVEFDYKSGASVEKRAIEKGRFNMPELAAGWTWKFASRVVERRDGTVGSVVYARLEYDPPTLPPLAHATSGTTDNDDKGGAA